MVRSLTVLYDAQCPLCARVRGWLEHQAQLVPLHWVACGSPEARTLLPHLDHDRTTEEVTVVADTGEVWTAEGAWIACLWATVAYRPLAQWLSHPARRHRARAVALAVAARRPTTVARRRKTVAGRRPAAERPDGVDPWPTEPCAAGGCAPSQVISHG